MTLSSPPIPPLAVPFYLSLTEKLYTREFSEEDRLSLESVEPLTGYLSPLIIKYAGKEFVFLGDEPVYARRFKVMGLRYRFEFWVDTSTEDELVVQVRLGDRKMVLSKEDYALFTEKVKELRMKRLQKKLKEEEEKSETELKKEEKGSEAPEPSTNEEDVVNVEGSHEFPLLINHR
jgi:hypothetical protein